MRLALEVFPFRSNFSPRAFTASPRSRFMYLAPVGSESADHRGRRELRDVDIACDHGQRLGIGDPGDRVRHRRL